MDDIFLSARCSENNIGKENLRFIKHQLDKGISKSSLIRDSIKVYKKLEEGKLYDKETVLAIINSDKVQRYKSSSSGQSKKKAVAKDKITEDDILKLFKSDDVLKG